MVLLAFLSQRYGVRGRRQKILSLFLRYLRILNKAEAHFYTRSPTVYNHILMNQDLIEKNYYEQLIVGHYIDAKYSEQEWENGQTYR
jgi:hypothetical protein